MDIHDNVSYTLPIYFYYRTQALIEWKNRAVVPTYHCLLCICIAAEWADSANVIIELLENE